MFQLELAKITKIPDYFEWQNYLSIRKKKAKVGENI
jgi:hypothetical protein